jgi:hypothetical protein
LDRPVTTLDNPPSAGAAESGSYPYGTRRLVPNWRSRKAQVFIGIAAFAATAAVLGRRPLALAAADDIALRIVFPAFLAGVLALVPAPATRLGQIAKDLTALGIVAAMFGGDLVPIMVASFPLVLAASVLLSGCAVGRRLWPERR